MAFEPGGAVLARETLALQSRDRHEARKRVVFPVVRTKRYLVRVPRMSTDC